MARCDYPQKVLSAGTRAKNGKVYNADVMVPCGKCYNCRMRRIRSWIFRLQKENEVCRSAHFVTLTYDNKNVPLTEKKWMTLDKTDVQKFFKRLRHKEENIKYYAVGEYGGHTQRPHYHIILFNCIDIENVFKTWDKGDVHYGNVTKQSIAYTLEYVSKQSDVPNWKDVQKEFSLYSKGIGKSYLSKEVIKFHKQNKMDMYITIEDGTKIPMPRYYRNKIFTEQEKTEQALYIGRIVAEDYEREVEKKGIRQMDNERLARIHKLNNKKTKNKEI